jgi:Cys-rich repeat protein
MQLRKMMVMLAAVGAVGLMLNGCGDDETTTTTCTQTSDCTGTEICHPTAKVCVATCSSASDCPDTSKNCAALGGTGADASTKVCQCQTNSLCNGGDAAGTLVCSDLDKQCVNKCTTDTDCGSGRTCDTGTGQCKAGGTTGGTCSGEGQTTCSYGSACYSGTCSAPPTPACENYQNFSNKSELGTTGPIIFKVATASSTTDTTFCGTTSPKRVKITISAYSGTPFPATAAELNGFFYVLVNGNKVAPSISSSSGNYTVTGTNRERADIVANLCVSSTSTTTSLGYYFTGGNFYCFQSTY